MTLRDRKSEFVERNKTVCQEDCVFKGYNYTTKKSKYSCKAKESPPSFAKMKIEPFGGDNGNG